MPTITFTLSDTPSGAVAIHSSFSPAIGAPCSPAQSAALEILARTRKQYELETIGQLKNTSTADRPVADVSVVA